MNSAQVASPFTEVMNKPPETEVQNKGTPSEAGEEDVISLEPEAKFKFGDEVVTGQQLREWAGLGKLERSVQSERDKLREQYNQLKAEHAELKGKYEQLASQQDAFAQLLQQPQQQQEEEPPLLERLFEELSTPQNTAEESYYDSNAVTLPMLKQILQANNADLVKNITQQLQTVPSRDELQAAVTETTQQQVAQLREAQLREQQAAQYIDEQLKTFEQEYVDKLGWTEEEARQYHLKDEMATKLRADAQLLAQQGGSLEEIADLMKQSKQAREEAKKMEEEFTKAAEERRKEEERRASVLGSKPTFPQVSPDIFTQKTEEPPNPRRVAYTLDEEMQAKREAVIAARGSPKFG